MTTITPALLQRAAGREGRLADRLDHYADLLRRDEDIRSAAYAKADAQRLDDIDKLNREIADLQESRWWS